MCCGKTALLLFATDGQQANALFDFRSFLVSENPLLIRVENCELAG